MSQPLSDDADEQKVAIAISLLEDGGGEETHTFAKALRLSLTPSARQARTPGTGVATDPVLLDQSDEEARPARHVSGRRPKDSPVPGDGRPVLSLESSDEEDEAPTIAAAAAAAQVANPLGLCGLPTPNEDQLAVLDVLDAGESCHAVGGAGTGKTYVEEAWAAKIDAAEGDNAALLVVAPYNTHVDNWKERARPKSAVWRAVGAGRRVMTAAAAFGLPKRGSKPDPAKMARAMHARVKALVRKPNFKLIIDERDLLDPAVRAAIGKTLEVLREDPRPDGGVQVLEAGDPFQGTPYQNEASKEFSPGARSIGPREELTVDSAYVKANPRPVRRLRRVERFEEPLYQDGAESIRIGAASKAAVALVAKGLAREYTEEEDLAAITLFGTTAEVMARDNDVALRRAAKLGLTEANGGVYVWDALKEHPELAAKYSEEELNAVRTFGLEKQVFFKGKRVLVVQKALLDEDGEEEGPSGDSLQFDDAMYVSGNAPGTVVGWVEGQYIEVKVDRRPANANTLKVRAERGHICMHECDRQAQHG